MGQREEVVAVAASQLGVHESGVNIQKYSEWQGNADFEWCASFACWCTYQVGIRFPANAQFGERGWAWTPSISTYYSSIGAYDLIPLPGDFGIRKDQGHTTLVVAVDESGVHTIEGNDQDSVRNEVHPVSWFHGFGHVPYLDGPSPGSREQESEFVL